MTTTTTVDQSEFLNAMYPVNGTAYKVPYQSTKTEKVRSKSFIIISAVLTIIFLLLAVFMFYLYKKDGADGQADAEIRTSIID